MPPGSPFGHQLAQNKIKADPSHSLKKGYGKDIERLLKLRSLGIFGFLVLLDKSSSFYGHFERKSKRKRQGDGFFNCIKWEQVSGKETSLAKILAISDGAKDFAAWSRILVSRVEPKAAHIEIYNVSVNDESQIRYYAYSRQDHVS